jgi:transcription elongation factor
LFIKVRLSDLQESMEEAQGLAELMGFKLYDLVGIEATVAGIVVGVGREELTVLDNFGTIRSLKPQQVRGSRNRESSQANAFDADGSPLKENGVVSVLVGANSSGGGGTSNTVKRIFKATVFLYSKERTQDAGIVVCRARDVRQVKCCGCLCVAEVMYVVGGLVWWV